MIRDHRHVYAYLVEETKTDGVPLETPSHNGPYQGPCRVRHLPPGVMGREGAGFLDGWATEARKRGGFKSLQRRKPKEARAARKPYQYIPRAPKPYKPPLRSSEIRRSECCTTKEAP